MTVLCDAGIIIIMNKLEFMRLWDMYGGLLTPTQREMTDMYFNLDLTVSEIAEQKGVSRQAVSECLAGCKKQLGEYEEALGHSKMFAEGDLHLSFLLKDIGAWAQHFLQLHPEYAADIGSLQDILQRDYSVEVASALSKIQGQ